MRVRKKERVRESVRFECNRDENKRRQVSRRIILMDDRGLTVGWRGYFALLLSKNLVKNEL